MGTVIQNSTLRALILEAFSSDKSLMKDIFDTIFNENPRFLEEYTSKNTATLENETKISSLEVTNHPTIQVGGAITVGSNSKTEGVSDDELNFWIDKHFKEYDAVFKALA
jgi:hypothetical protein